MIEKYYFLFALFGIWTVFASIEDFKKTEIANWANFSLLGFALAYRAFYSSLNNEWSFLGFGVLGFLVMFFAAQGLYYSRVFGGGDAKLLMAYGALLPIESYTGLLFNSIGFLALFFIVYVLWSLSWSVYLSGRNWKIFRKGFFEGLRKNRTSLFVSCLLGLVFFLLLKDLFGIVILLMLLFLPILYVHNRELEKCCMVKLVSPGKLMEGDWLEKSVRVRGKTIRKSVHGLSLKDIKFLRNANKKVLIKQGIPFTAAFLVILAVMGYFFLVLGVDFLQAFSFLS